MEEKVISIREKINEGSPHTTREREEEKRYPYFEVFLKNKRGIPLSIGERRGQGTAQRKMAKGSFLSYFSLKRKKNEKNRKALRYERSGGGGLINSIGRENLNISHKKRGLERMAHHLFTRKKKNGKNPVGRNILSGKEKKRVYDQFSRSLEGGGFKKPPRLLEKKEGTGILISRKKRKG